ncbi:hypothetical protein CEXT_123391 [Caerostris extrusa]|uniref:Uncharacterized protein n=1 Tax=Caerostris extrusa TaxID=172846 RepID=A0AAV4MQB8_CAEEX|nr:hypothetical protein CEXT_123391 [Caerostris extrusa]
MESFLFRVERFSCEGSAPPFRKGFIGGRRGGCVYGRLFPENIPTILPCTPKHMALERSSCAISPAAFMLTGTVSKCATNSFILGSTLLLITLN